MQTFEPLNQEKATKYLELAHQIARIFSKDPNTKVGSLFLAPGSQQVLSMGYNGFPRKFREDIPERWERTNKLKYIVHAEMNSLLNATRRGTPLENSIAIVTMFPCNECARAMIQSGVKQVVTHAPKLDCPKWGDSFRISMEMFEECGVQLSFVPESNIEVHANAHKMSA
jgi:dCMP deaminase